MEIAGIPHQNPLDYTGPKQNIIPIKVIYRIPTTTDVKYRIGTFALIGKNPVSGTQGHIYYLSNFNASGEAIWKEIDTGEAGPGIDYLVGDDSNEVGPDGDGKLNLVGDSAQGVSTSGTPASYETEITVADSTETQKGVLETSTDVESIAGTAANKAVVPSSLAAKLGVQTQYSIPYGEGTAAAFSWLGPLTDGQLVIGSTGNAPSAATLTEGTGISIANGAGSITISGTATVPLLFTEDVGTAAPAANNLNIVGGVGIATSGAGSTVTISSTGSGLAWVEVTAATQAMAVATSYGANRGAGVTFTLPATAAAGTVMEIVGMQGLWSLEQNAGQQIHVGNASTTAGVGGSITATNAHDCLVLRCVTADTTFVVQNMMGNPAIV